MNRSLLLGALIALEGGILGARALWAETSVENYFPLAIGNRLVYESGEHSGASSVVESWGVMRQEQNAFALQITLDNDSLSSFETFFVLAPTGIRRLAHEPQSQGTEEGEPLFVLKAPLTVGATWDNEDGRYEVTAVQKTATVPAGTFPNCVEVTHHSRGDRVTVVTLYAPGVGVVIRDETFPRLEGSGGFDSTRRDHVTLQLKEWTVARREE